MTDKEIVLSMIEGFKKVKGINQMPTLEVLKLIEMRLKREDEFNEFVETARNVLADIQGNRGPGWLEKSGHLGFCRLGLHNNIISHCN